MPINKRIKKVQQLLEDEKLDALVVTSPSNFFYFSGILLDSHERLQAIVIPKTGETVIIVHEMSKEEIRAVNIKNKVFWKDGDLSIDVLANLLPDTGVISIDNQWTSQNLLMLMGIKKNLNFVDSTSIIGKVKQIKDQTEIELLSKSSEIADYVMEKIFDFMKPGLTEKEVVDEIKRLFGLKGVTKLTFEPVVAAGKNGAIPHHQSNNTTIANGDMVVIDLGGIKDHYCSDMTRTVLVGEDTTNKKRQVYEIVQLAQEEAVKAIKPGIPINEIDFIARDIINSHGYGPNFIHRTGHGLGTELHEEPFVSSQNSTLIEEGMVFSVEPGIYLDGEFGVRIEDIVVVTATDCKRLNNVNRSLINIMNGITSQ